MEKSIYHPRKPGQRRTLRPDIPERLWTPGQAAAELGVTRQSIHEACVMGRIEAELVEDEVFGKRWRFTTAALRKYVENRRLPRTHAFADDLVAAAHCSG